MFQKITFKIILLIFIIGIIPFSFYGAYSINKAKSTSILTVINSNKKIANEISGRISQYLNNTIDILKSITENLSDEKLTSKQKEQILKNFTINFDNFQKILLINSNGKAYSSSEITLSSKNFSDETFFKKGMKNKIYISDIYINSSSIPSIRIAIPLVRLLNAEGVLFAEMDLLHLWKLVESLKIGQKGFVSLANSKGFLFASGNGYEKINSINMKKYDQANILSSNSIQFEHIIKGTTYITTYSKISAPFSWYVIVEQPKEEAFQLANKMEKQFLYTMILFTLFIIFIGVAISNQIFLKPLNKIMDRIHDISKGNLGGKINLPNQGEFSELALTLNTMSQDLIDYQKELVLKEKQALLGNIASGVAHDLKHPITSIEGYVKLLERKHDSPEFRKQFLNVINRDLSQLHYFLENLKELSKSHNHNPRRLPLKPFLEEFLRSTSPVLQQKNISLTLIMNDDITTNYDPFSFQRVIQNLVSNAAEALKENGDIKILVSKIIKDGKNYTLIEVCDNGCGIPAEILKNLFQDYVTTKRSGIGLGLTIVKKIVERHSGEITVESVVDQGTSFKIFLPLDS